MSKSLDTGMLHLLKITIVALRRFLSEALAESECKINISFLSVGAWW